MSELDITAAGITVNEPFPHVVFDENTLLRRDEAERLAATLPSLAAMTESVRTKGSDKTYSMNTLLLHDRGRWLVRREELPGCWRNLLSRLVDSSYRDRLVGRLGGANEGRVELEVRLSEYPRGGWMSRHTDRPDKVFSQNIYLCPEWRPTWGGQLLLYHEQTAVQPQASYQPGAGTSVAFVPSDRSWHEVAAVSDSATIPRRALLLHGYRSTA
ncbi:2OG-Fe(II) oxygenase [Nocardia anaemiae]|uniref:2OG-Fe(II) oxygenase n=1 Tax=Nocardia anaemiae TaxID=263910 RepID=UPI0007A4EE31|nr:2OG-Fe(II) oxygenase [Nocardia anaemiae]